jgi:hypothetical protein
VCRNEAPPLLCIGKGVCDLEHQRSPKHPEMQQVTNQEVTRVRTMCGSRIGGWSLPCVMSD